MDASANMKTNEENSNEESKQNVEDGDAEEGFAEGEVAERGDAERGDADQDRGDDRGDEIEYSSDTEEEDVEGATRRKRGKSGWNVYLGSNTVSKPYSRCKWREMYLITASVFQTQISRVQGSNIHTLSQVNFNVS